MNSNAPTKPEISALTQSLVDEIIKLRQQLDAKTREAARWREVAAARYTAEATLKASL